MYSENTTDVLVDANLLDEVVHRIVEVIHPAKIILFGSRSRRDAHHGSDMDLLVIARSSEPRHRRSAPLYGALSDILIPMDILVYTPDEVKEWAEVRQAFISTAVREGTLLYENQG